MAELGQILRLSGVNRPNHSDGRRLVSINLSATDDRRIHEEAPDSHDKESNQTDHYPHDRADFFSRRGFASAGLIPLFQSNLKHHHLPASTALLPKMTLLQPEALSQF